MRFASSIVAAEDLDSTLHRLLDPISQRITPGMVDLALIFATPHFNDDLPELLERLAGEFSTAITLGCTAEGTIGRRTEIEREPSISLLVASMPGVTFKPFHIRQKQLEKAVSPADWERIVGVSPNLTEPFMGSTGDEETTIGPRPGQRDATVGRGGTDSDAPGPACADRQPIFLALADPFSIDLHALLESLNGFYPGAPLIGGVASAARQPRHNRLILNGEIYNEGLVGVAMKGRLAVETIVSQGCRPIGTPFVITRGERNVVLELGGKPALERLHEIVVALPAEEEELARQSLFVGRVIDEYKDRFGRGDFLIHNIVAVDRKSGAIGIAGRAKTGATVQFHVRDARSADEDLRAMLAAITSPPSTRLSAAPSLSNPNPKRQPGAASDPDHDPSGSGIKPSDPPPLPSLGSAVAEGGGAQHQGGGLLSPRPMISYAGALLFGCNGRGTHMWDTPGHDANALADALGDNLPVAGFFCGGEFGPVGGKNFIHGFTASIALFLDPYPGALELEL